MSRKILEQTGSLRLLQSILTDGSKVFDVEVGPVTFYMDDPIKAAKFYELLTTVPYEVPNEDMF